MTLTLIADTEIGGGGQGLQTAYVTLVGTVTNAEGATIYTKTIPRVKGIQLDLPRATNEAYYNALDIVKKEFIPGLIRLWHGF